MSDGQVGITAVVDPARMKFDVFELAFVNRHTDRDRLGVMDLIR